MRASQEHHNAVGALDVKSLIIGEWIWLGAGPVQIERPSHVFKLCNSRNLPGYPYPRDNLGRLRGPDHRTAVIPEDQLVRAWNPYASVGRCLPSRILRMERCRVEEYPGLPGMLQCRVKSSSMIVVAVADRDGVNFAQTDSKSAHILRQHLTLSGVEEQAPAVHLNQE